MKKQTEAQRQLHAKSTAHKILLQTTTETAMLLEWLRNNLSEYERLRIGEWYGSRFYVEVIDTRKGWEPVSDMRCWFTVDLRADAIMWNDNIPQHGNCGVRTNKWKSLILKKFGLEAKERVHWYKNHYLKGEKP